MNRPARTRRLTEQVRRLRDASTEFRALLAVTEPGSALAKHRQFLADRLARFADNLERQIAPEITNEDH